MAYIRLPDFNEMDPAIQRELRPIFEKTGNIGEIMKIIAIKKNIFFATDKMAKSYLLDKTELSFKIKERIALLVSLENGCKMCVGIHKQIARMLGMSEEEVEQAAKGIEFIEVEENEKKLLEFSLKASRKDNYKTTQKDIDDLKKSGFTESQILEAVALVGYFNYINTISNVFGLES